MQWLRRVGFSLIAFGLVPWGLWKFSDSKDTWFFANDVPITLSNGSHYTTGAVKTDMSALYSIYINADVPKGVGDDYPTDAEKEMEWEIGVNNPKKDPCPDLPVWKFKWTLTSDGGTVQGNSDEIIGQGRVNSATGIFREIGEFKTEAGRTYKFDLQVLFDNRDPRITNPRLMIAVSDFHAGSSMFISGLLGIVCPATATVGTVLVLGSFSLGWWQQRSRPQQPDN